MKLYIACVLMLLCSNSMTLLADTKSGVVVFVRVGAAQTEQFKPYMDLAAAYNLESIHFHITINPLMANHVRDYRNLRKQVQELGQKYSRVYTFGYSIGGKFSARLARDEPEIRGAFLLDPVDGGPPIFPRRFSHLPVFFKRNSTIIQKPTWVLETEFAQKPNSTIGLRCVNYKLGAKHFLRYISRKKRQYHLVEDAGHLQLIEALSPESMEEVGHDACPAGSRSLDDIMEESIAFWHSFLRYNLEL